MCVADLGSDVVRTTETSWWMLGIGASRFPAPKLSQTSLICLPRRSALENREPLTLQFRWKTGRVSLVQVVLNHREKDKATGWIGSVIECAFPSLRFPRLSS